MHFWESDSRMAEWVVTSTRVPPWLSPLATAIGVWAVLGVIVGLVTGSVLTVVVWATVAAAVALGLYVRRATMRRQY